MKYRKVKDVEINQENNEFMDAVAQCMLQLLSNRLCKEEESDLDIDEKFDIDYDFSMYGDKLMKMRNELGYSSEKFIDSADNFVRKL